VYGALRRIVRRPRRRDALLMGLGLAILANSRPFEGLLASLPAGAALLLWIMKKKGPQARVSISRIVLPLFSMLALTGGTMTFYNHAVTGDPLRLPYLVYDQTYLGVPNFLWQRPKPEPEYRHEWLRDFRRRSLVRYLQQRSLSGLVEVKGKWFKGLWRFYLGPALTVPLLMLPWVLKDRWMRFALLTCGLVMVGLLVEMWMQPHYAAPIAGLLFALVLQAMRRLRVWRWRGRPAWQFAMWVVVGVCVVSAPLKQGKPATWILHRADIVAQLHEGAERHLVLVRYRPWHFVRREWVDNGADIDREKVAWAREMEAAQNRALLNYFKDRLAWLLEADAEPPRLTPYPVGSNP